MILAPLASLLPLLAAPPTSQEPAPEDRLGAFAAELGELEGASAAVWDGEGQLLVVETAAHRIAVLGSGGERLDSWGRRGSGPGELLFPEGIARAPDGALYVADTGNHRVQVLDAGGGFVRAFGRRGHGPGQLLRPAGLAVGGDRVAVADTGNHRVQVFDRDGKPLFAAGGHGGAAGAFRRPRGVAFLPGGDLLVADTGNHRVQRLDPGGRPVAAWGEWGPYPGLFAEPTGIDVEGGRVYVADRDNHRVQVFDPAGDYLYEWGVHAIRPREGRGALHYPAAVAVEPGGGRAAVCEALQDRCQLFGPAAGPPEDYMADPRIFSGGAPPHYGMPVAAAGPLLTLIEPETQSVRVFDLRPGTPVEITRFGSHGSGPLRFTGLCDLSLRASDWSLYASDRDARCVQRFALDFDPEGRLRFDPALPRFELSADLNAVLAARGTELEQPLEPGALARDGRGRLYVIDVRGERVAVFGRDWELLALLGQNGAGMACM